MIILIILTLALILTVFFSAYSSVYIVPGMSSLQNLLSYSLKPRRFSLWCKILCSRPSNNPTPNQTCQSWTGQLFVTDASLQYMKTQEAQCNTKTSLTQETQHSQYTGEPSSTQGAQNVIDQYLKIDVRPSYTMTELLHKAVISTGGVFYFQDIVCSGIGE